MQAAAQARPAEMAPEPQIETTTASGAALSVVTQAQPEASPPATSSLQGTRRGSRGRLRTRFARFRGDAEALRAVGASDADADQGLTLMLLREENARLKGERHRLSDLGTMVDQMRVTGADDGKDNVLDDVYGLLSECLAIREGLDRACDEIHAAMTSVQARLSELQRPLPAASPVPAASPLPTASALSGATRDPRATPIGEARPDMDPDMLRMFRDQAEAIA